MKGDADVIAVLNDVLTAELTAIPWRLLAQTDIQGVVDAEFGKIGDL